MKTVSSWFTRVSTKSLALAAVAALGAACGTAAPTSPSLGALVDDAGGSGAATTLAFDPGPINPCADVATVSLSLVPTPKGRILVRAKYTERALPVCARGPVWSTSPQGLVRPTKDPFLVTIADTPATRLMVSAAAPNGRQGTLRIR